MTILKTNGIAMCGLSFALVATIFSSATQAQSPAVHTPWEMIRTDVVDVKPPFATTHGDPANYAYAKLPDPGDKRWEIAPVNEKGQLHLDELSRLAQGQNYKKLDFTYFRTLVYVSDDTPSITEFRVTIAEVDDGARMYLYNDNHLGGVYNEADDAKLMGKNVSTDFAGDAVPGWNMITIAQFDDAWKHNRLLNGVEIKVNGVVAKPISLEDLEPDGGRSKEDGGSGEDDWPGDGGGSDKGGAGNNIADGPGGKNMGDPDGGGSNSGGRVAGKLGSDGNAGGPDGARKPATGNNGNGRTEGSGHPKSGGGSTGNRIAGGVSKGGSGSGNKGNVPRFNPKNATFFPKRFTMETFGVFGQGRQGPENRYFIGWKTDQPHIISKAADGVDGSYIFVIEKEEVPGGVALKVANYRAGDPGKSYYLPNLSEEKHVYQVKEPLWNERVLTEDHEYNFRSLYAVDAQDSFLRHTSYRLYDHAAPPEAADDEQVRRIYQQDATWHFHPLQELSTELAGTTTKSGYEYTLTTNDNDQSGAVWTSNEINFGRDFEIRAEIYLGDTDEEGADGMALVFQNEDNHLVGKGGELGYKGISPSYIIEFDTYQNRDEFHDPKSDHVGLRSDGSPVHNNDFVEVENLEDGNFHPISFEWNAESKTFNFKLDGRTIFENRKFPESKFSGTKSFFGFTAATGLYKNAHKVRAITFSN